MSEGLGQGSTEGDVAIAKVNIGDLISEKITTGLKGKGNTLEKIATLTEELNGKKLQAEISFNRPSEKGNEFELIFNTTTFRVKVKRVQKNEICLKIYLGESKSNFYTSVEFEPITDFEEDEDSRSSRLSKIGRLPRINQTPDLMFLASYWFPKVVQNNDTINTENQGRKTLKLEGSYKDYWPCYDQDLNTWSITVPPLNDDLLLEQWVSFCVAVAVRIILVRQAYFPKEFPETGFPGYKKYIPTRPVNLETHKVKGALEEKKITLPWRVIETACSSLNAGKHVIFTGPPGCGKTKLSKILAEKAGIGDPIIVTASPTWTTDELIGRYMPETDGESARKIKFSPGFFLRAIDGDKWLIIDELNRADIDACFGELFTVLSGEPSILPFEELSKNEENEKEEMRPIVIMPSDYGDEGNTSFSTYKSYSIGARFRIIGTMNDADASRLNHLSFAFQRRFNIIRVEAPEFKDAKKLIEERIKNQCEKIAASGIRNFYKQLRKSLEINATDTLINLFAVGPEDLLQKRVVGVAQVLDVIDFMLEGLSAPKAGRDGPILAIAKGKKVAATIQTNVVNSYIALGVTMLVFPQLMALTGEEEELGKVVESILGVFKGNEFTRIIGSGSKYEIEERGPIENFLKEELRRLFRNVQLPIVEDLIKLKNDATENDAT